jgi:hypothetical protein
MSFINYVTKQVAIKVVYYGPGLSGKTTNLRYIYFKLDPSHGQLSAWRQMQRTSFFGLLPVKASLIGDSKSTSVDGRARTDLLKLRQNVPGPTASFSC